MLDGLDEIPWEDLTHAYGAAGDIPEQIRALRSDDPEEWVGAISSLYDALCHQQCTVYEATPPAIPFLVELLGDRRVRCRGKILQFLGDAARATSYLHAHASFFSEQEQADPGGVAAQRAEELDWVRRTRRAAWDGAEVYLDLLADLDRRVRISAPYALGPLIMSGHAEMPDLVAGREPLGEIADRFRRQVDEEPNELVRASLAFGLGCVALRQPEATADLARLAGEPPGPVALAAALGLADVLSEDLPDGPLAVLLAALGDPDRTDAVFDAGEPGIEGKHHPLAQSYRAAGATLDDDAGTGHDPDDIGADEDFEFPWLDGRTTTAVLERIERVAPARLDRILPMLLPHLDRCNPNSCDSVAGPILRLVFGKEVESCPIRPEALTASQAEVLGRLHANLGLWASNSANPMMTFAKAGLPSDRAAWDRLLAVEPREPDDAEIDAILRRLAGGQGSEMRNLSLSEIGTPAFLPHLKQFPDLESLALVAMPLVDADLVHLRALPKLKWLFLSHTPITDRGAEILATLAGLRFLEVGGTRITDAGLAALARLEGLRELWGAQLGLSDTAARRFEAARPDCRLFR